MGRGDKNVSKLNAFVLATCLLLVLSACGIKGPPRPPSLVTPAPVADLAALSRENNVTLAWTRPLKNTDGSLLKDLASFHLYRKGEPVEVGKTKKEGPGFILIATIDAERSENALREGDRYLYQDRGLPYDQRYLYRLVSINRRGLGSPVSNEVAIEVTVPPAAPTDLKAEATEGMVTLQWEPPKVKADGSPLGELKGYNVYRGEKSANYGPRPINRELVRETEFRDLGLINDKTYYYMVRAVDREGPPAHEGLDSTEVAVTPQDMTPPRAPRGLKAIPGETAIHLAWDTNTEEDLLGYYVYRSLIPGRAYQRLNDTPILRTTFTDKDVRPNTLYYYVIIAVDSSPRRNQSAPSTEVSAQLP